VNVRFSNVLINKKGKFQYLYLHLSQSVRYGIGFRIKKCVWAHFFNQFYGRYIKLYTFFIRTQIK